MPWTAGDELTETVPGTTLVNCRLTGTCTVWNGAMATVAGFVTADSPEALIGRIGAPAMNVNGLSTLRLTQPYAGTASVAVAVTWIVAWAAGALRAAVSVNVNCWVVAVPGNDAGVKVAVTPCGSQRAASVMGPTA